MIKKNITIKVFLITAIIVVVLIIFNIPDNSDPFAASIKIIKTKNYSKCPLLFKYSIKILSEKPNSIETMYLLENLLEFLKKEETLDCFEPIYNNYDIGNITSIGNVNESTSEKIMIATLIAFGIGKSNETRSIKEFDIIRAKGTKFLKEILTNCNDKNYKSIIDYMFILLRSNIDNNGEGIDEFIVNYPNHIFNSKLNLYKLSISFYKDVNDGQKLDKDKINKIIYDAIKYAKEYEPMITPFGYSIADEYYYLLCNIYFEIKDIKKSIEYVKLLEKDNYDKEKTEQISKILYDFH